MTDAFDFTRYLAAKRSVDDRALNRHVWETLADAVRADPPPERPLRVLEVGAGIGTMVERCVEWGLFSNAGFGKCPQAGVAKAFAADYSAIDSEESNIDAARQRLARLSSAAEAGLRLRLQTANLYDFAARRENRQRFDLLIAHALLDLLHLPTALPSLLGMLRPGGLFYFSINFDGATLFVPEIDPALDRQIEALYHRSMDTRMTDGQPSAARDADFFTRCGSQRRWRLAAPTRWAPADVLSWMYSWRSTLRGHPDAADRGALPVDVCGASMDVWVELFMTDGQPSGKTCLP